MKEMFKSIVYRSIGALLSMAMLCGCAAPRDSGAIEGDAGTLASSIEMSSAGEVNITLLSEDVTEESVGKVKDAWQRLSEIVPLSDIEFAIGPANKQVKRDGLVNFTEREIEEDNFIEVFTDKCTDLTYWKTIGLSEYAFDYPPVHTEDEVKEYLEKRETKPLPLFALFFFEMFSEESDMQMSRDCAYYLTKYALEKYSYEDFFANEYRNEWLTNLGSTADFRFDEIDEVVEAARVEKKGKAVYLVCAGNTWDIREVEWAKTADDVYSLLYDAEEGIRKLCKRIAAESDIYDEESFRKNVTIIAAVSTDKKKRSHARNMEIYLGNQCDFLHEYVHCTLGFPYYGEMWLADGLAVYYSLDYEDDYTYNHNLWDDTARKMWDEGIIDDETMAKMEQAGTEELDKTAIEYYQKLREKDKGENTQFSCYKYAAALTELTFFGTEMYEKAAEHVITISDIYGNEVADKLGNDLTYYAAMVITDDLIEKYGIDYIISSSGSFEEDFGMTSDEYIQNYIDNKSYMHFLED